MHGRAYAVTTSTARRTCIDGCGTSSPDSRSVCTCRAIASRTLISTWSFDPDQPAWQAYLHGLRDEDSDAAWTHHLYLQRRDRVLTFNGERLWGCFSYDYLADQRTIGLHFSH